MNTFFKSVAIVAALAAGSFAQNMDSREGDSLALVAIKNANPDGGHLELAGMNKYYPRWWDTTQPIQTWVGVTVKNGRVTTLDFTESYTNGKGFCRVSVIPEEINNLKHISSINFSGIGIKSLPNNFSGLSKLDTLNLRFNEIQKLPNGIFSLTGLKDLNLGGNQLTEIPKEIGNLTTLRNLGVWGNKLVTLPREIGNLINLISLEIGSNKFEVLPEELGNLKLLTSLEISDYSRDSENNDALNGKITSIPKGIGNISNLRSLTINCPLLTDLPTEIGNLPYLETLTINSGNFTSIPDHFANLKHLKTLTISHTKLEILPENIALIYSLRTIDISSNMIAKLPNNLFLNAQLASIKLDSNKLSQLPETILQSKAVLSLAGNLLYRNTMIDSIVYWLDDHVKGQWWATETAISDQDFIKTKKDSRTAQFTGNTIKFSADLPVGTTINLYDLSGRNIVSGVVSGNQFNVGSLGKGVYVTRIGTGTNVQNIKIVVQ